MSDDSSKKKKKKKWEDFCTNQIQLEFRPDGNHVLQQAWQLYDGSLEWRDVPIVMTKRSGVSFG